MKKRSQLKIKTVRMNNDLRDSPADMAQAVLDLKASDPQGRWGVDSVKQRLANSDVFLSRYVIACLAQMSYGAVAKNLSKK